MEGVIFLDLETTGLGENDEIIEIGAIKVNGKEEQTYQQLINPAIERISPRIFKLCRGITEEDLRISPGFDDIREEFLEFIGDLPLVCHNAAFEKRMLEKALGRELKNTLLDSLELFCLFKPHFPGHNLQYLLQHYLKENRPEMHRALADARDTIKLVQKLFADLAETDCDLLEETLQKMHGTDWSWLPYLQEITPTSLKQVTITVPFYDKDESECAYTLNNIERLLKNEKAWQKYFPGYIFRPQQLQMALSVADSFQGKQAIFIEAPTGSGKTLAYLLAALLFAVNEKEQVFISTNTKNLQQQVLDDLPQIAAVLGIENLRFTDMMGIANYACRRRAEEEAGNPGGALEARLAKSYLLNWIRRTTTGVLDDLSYWFRFNNPNLNTLINTVGCRREECDGHECSYKGECFYRRKVEMMRNAHLCLINHSLLLTWPGGYPEVKRLIIDEAHALEKKAFEAFTREVSSFELGQLLSRLIQGGNKGYLHYLLFYGRKVLPALEIGPALGTINQIRQYADNIALLLEPYQDEKYSKRIEIPKDYAELEEAVLSLSSGLAILARFLEETMAEISIKDEDFEKTTLFRQGEEYMKICRAWSGLLEGCFEEEEDEKNCHYLECSRNKWSFRIAPLDVAELFHSRVLSGCDSLVLTSATLAEKDGYDRHVRALGFDRLEPERLVLADPLPDVYDYWQNSVLAIPSDSPGYSDDSFADYAAKAVIGAAKMLGGRTMALFTSLERMQRVIEKVRAPLEKEGISVLGGENSSRRGDLEHFREDENAVLFGSRGFFEGVDISGPALSCIIIDKLSFPYQDDPLLKARVKYLEETGLNPFNDLLLADVKRTLRQQFGRLIRSETDRGFVLVLDQLGGGKRYRDSVLEELPDPQILKNVKLEEILDKMKERFIEWGYEICRAD
jgi:ATP-dependent DNA helicase DinG